MCTKNRKARSKRKRPKYLNLNLNTKLCELKKAKIGIKKKKKQVFNLPTEVVADDDGATVASFLFDTNSDSTATLDGLLKSSAVVSGEDRDSSPLSETFLCPPACGREKLMRSAMRRCKERDESEERWVSYSEVVEKIVKEEEVNSSNSSDVSDRDRVRAGAWKRKLDLKLDYDEVLNAWSDKGSLFVDGESPQTVPDLQNDNVMGMESWNLWRVPEISNEDDGGGDEVKVNEDENWRREHRVASMLRYKEKRRNRLFAKRIRYEVRKLNAEKRPRMKGRFVKRSLEE